MPSSNVKKNVLNLKTKQMKEKKIPTPVARAR